MVDVSPNSPFLARSGKGLTEASIHSPVENPGDDQFDLSTDGRVP